MKVTLQQIKDANACREGYRKLAEYVRDNGIKEPFCPSIILKSNNIADTLWVLKWVCGEEGLRICREFAIDCSLRVLPIFEEKYPDDKRPREAIEAAQKYINGGISIGELREKHAAADAAYAAYAAADAAADAAYAAYAAYAAADAAGAAAGAAADAAADAGAAYAAGAVDARNKERKRQENKLRELIEACE